MVEGLVNTEPLNSEPPPKLRALRTVGSNKQWHSCTANGGHVMMVYQFHTSQITHRKSPITQITNHRNHQTSNQQSHIENHQSQSTNHTNHTNHKPHKSQIT